MAGMTFRRTNGAIGDGAAGKEFAMTLWRFVKSWLEYYRIISYKLAWRILWLYREKQGKKQELIGEYNGMLSR